MPAVNLSSPLPEGALFAEASNRMRLRKSQHQADAVYSPQFL